VAVLCRAALAQLGRLDAARAALPDPAGAPFASIAEIRCFESYLQTVEFDRLIEVLRKLGFPE
jgi:hypothetical protein